MNKTSISSMISLALLVISQAAAAVECQVYEASVGPAVFLMKEGSVGTQPLAHTVVVRNAGFRQNQIEFFIFPPVLTNERSAFNTSATGSESSSGTASSSGASGPQKTPGSPDAIGGQSRPPLPGQVVIMSNSAFFGDLNFSIDPAMINQTVASARDFGKFGIVGGSVIGFSLSQVSSTLNRVLAPLQQSATEGSRPLQLVDGLIRFKADNDNNTIAGTMRLTAVDEISNPTVEVQYETAFDGSLVKQVSC